MLNYPNSPGHRRLETSVAAAVYLAPKLGRIQQAVYGAIRRAGSRGLTACELARELSMDRYTVQPRTSELRAKGMIYDSLDRRINASGKMAIVWIASEVAQ